ncbi:MAG: succinate dehydrogenase, cytochrome b556 subunit [Betaproteobacteria bacterium HGW-Betaproteobacteria-11]|nr:MAG: succinate dehydrogenase, cytochrome b556 subunit [Betaproteobacteria bacterium HGW-Betaproteobacteria-11]
MQQLTKPRPKFLALNQIRQPLAAIASILHRLSGAGLFLMLPLLIWLLQLSLATSTEDMTTFKAVKDCLAVRLILLGLVWAFLHHFCMGIRLLFIDMHIGVEKQASHTSAKAVFGISLTLTLIFGLKLLGVY